jgi:hypothetical protein
MYIIAAFVRATTSGAKSIIGAAGDSAECPCIMTDPVAESRASLQAHWCTDYLGSLG